MEQFPSNSLGAKKPTPAKDSTPKKIEKVVVGDVIRQKKPLGRRLSETFFGGDAQGVVGYVFMDVLVPALKDLTVDIVNTAIEKAIFGEVRGTGRRSTGRYGSSSSGYTNYNRYSSTAYGRQSEPPSRGREEPRELSRRARSRHEFDEIILATRAEAQEVIDRMFDLISQYESATLADLYELVGVSGNYTDEKYGWTDFRGAGITRIRGGYLLDLPQPELLK